MWLEFRRVLFRSLEAKYELAQMYIEIGDPDAARETLNELVDEANGDILEKSKALLAEISWFSD